MSNNTRHLEGRREIHLMGVIELQRMWAGQMRDVGYAQPDFIKGRGGEARAESLYNDGTVELIQKASEWVKKQHDLGMDMAHDPVGVASAVLRLITSAYAMADRSWLEIADGAYEGLLDLYERPLRPDNYEGHVLFIEISERCNDLLEQTRGLGSLVDSWAEAANEHLESLSPEEQVAAAIRALTSGRGIPELMADTEGLFDQKGYEA